MKFFRLLIITVVGLLFTTSLSAKTDTQPVPDTIG